MNRSAFQNVLARTALVVTLVVSALGCATAPEIAPVATAEASRPVGAPEQTLPAPDVSLQQPIAKAAEAALPVLVEPSPVWIDDTLPRRSALRSPDLVAQPPAPTIDAIAASTEPEAPAPEPSAVPAPSVPASVALDPTSMPRSREPASETTPSPRAGDPGRTADLHEDPAARADDPAPARPADSVPGEADEPRRSSEPQQSSEPDSRPATGLALAAGRESLAATADRPPDIERARGGSGVSSSDISGDGGAPSTVSPAPGGTPASGVTPTSEPATLWNERSAGVASGSEVSVVLPGSGWLYVGKEYGDGDIQLLGRSRAGNDEVFRFRVGEPGDYGLWFQQQDSLSGSLVNERLGLRASESESSTDVALAELPEGVRLSPVALATPAPTDPRRRTEDFTASTSVDAIPADATPVDATPFDAMAAAVDLIERAAIDDGLAAFVEAVDNGRVGENAPDDTLVERFAEAARARSGSEGPSPVIRSFWRRVASSGSAVAPEARRALLEIATRSGDAGEIAAAVSALEHAGEASVDDMVRAADALLGAGQGPEALPLLARAVSLDGSALDAVEELGDRWLFELARLLERPGPERDLRRSASLYRIIVDDRPLSAHWEESQSRLEYLSRHYFEVR